MENIDKQGEPSFGVGRRSAVLVLSHKSRGVLTACSSVDLVDKDGAGQR